MMSFDDVSVFFDIFGDFRDGSSFLIIDGLVKQGEGILDFCINSHIPRRWVCTWPSSFAGAASSLLFGSLLSFSMSILKNR